MKVPSPEDGYICLPDSRAVTAIPEPSKMEIFERNKMMWMFKFNSFVELNESILVSTELVTGYRHVFQTWLAVAECLHQK